MQGRTEFFGNTKETKLKKKTSRKGIILAGGNGSRLLPLTLSTSKQLLPVFDKPMIYYPLSTLMLSDIKDILVISTPRDLPDFERLLGNGSQWGIKLAYAEQAEPRGLAQAFIIGEHFISDSNVVLVLGDNIFHAKDIRTTLLAASEKQTGATIFGYYVNNPEEYGVVVFDEKKEIQRIEEKPDIPKSNYAVTGIYYYDNSVIEIAKTLVPSARGEIEITDINNIYLETKTLSLELFSHGTAWLDAGLPSTLLDAANFVRIVEER